MTKHRTLIVDDEPLARERLRTLLSKQGTVELIGECESGPDAAAAIRAHQPEIVFLDVQLPGYDGLQVVAQLPAEQRPAIVFVTAHDRFAVEAFAAHAVDYLLKPFDSDRLDQALKRAAAYLRARRAGTLETRLENLLAASAPRETRDSDRIAVKADGRIVFVRKEDIVWVEAANNYCVLHLNDAKRFMLRDTLTGLEERLGPTAFARVNRSTLVRTELVKEIELATYGDYTVVLQNGLRFPLSRNLRGQWEKFGSSGASAC